MKVTALEQISRTVSSQNAGEDLRALYQSARRLARSDDVEVLLNILVEDISRATELERLVVLLQNEHDSSFEGKVFAGYRKFCPNARIAFGEMGRLLRKVYEDKAPLHVEGTEPFFRPDSALFKCGIFRNVYNEAETNRRQSVNLCVRDINPLELRADGVGQYGHYSILELNRHDLFLHSLLGDVSSFVILPIYDDRLFYGYILADKIYADGSVTYEEIRLAAAMANHGALAIGRARNQNRMLRKISIQNTDILEAHVHLSQRLEEIEELKSFYQSIMQNLRSGLITVDIYMKISDVNKAAEISLGYSRDELLGKPLDFVFSDSDERKQCLFVDTAEDLDVDLGYLSEVSFRKRGGEVVPMEACFSVIIDSNDDISGLSCIFRDISKRKLLEQNMARIDKLASLGELAAGMAHEIRNPLAGIGGALQILARNYDDDDPNQTIFQEVLRQIKRLDSFVKNLLQFARPNPLTFSPVKLDQLLDRVLFLVASQIEEKKIRVDCQYAENSPFSEGDEGQLQQVFLNIILNALDAMEEGGTLTVNTCWERQSGKCEPDHQCIGSPCGPDVDTILVSIKDTGKGIGEESLEMIFNPFHTTKSNGTGLGLAISHRIIEQHHGSIFVTSQTGTGSTFTVSLPLLQQGGTGKRLKEKGKNG